MAEDEQRVAGAERVPDLPGDGDALFAPGRRLRLVALPDRDRRRPVQDPNALHRAGSGAPPDRPLQPAAPLGEVAAEKPERPQRRGQSHAGSDAPDLRQPRQRRPHVGVLRLQHVAPPILRRGEPERRGPLGQVEAPGSVGTPDRRLLAARGELLQGVLADGLQHPEPGLAVGARLPMEQAPVDQRREGREDVELRAVARPADRLRRLQRTAAGEDGQAAEEDPLLFGEQVVAPGDGVAQGAQPRRLVARPAGQQRQPALQPRQQRRRREDGAARGGQLDRQRQPVQADADGGDARGVVVSEGEVGPRRPRSGTEEADRRRSRRPPPPTATRPGSGTASGGTGNWCSPETRTTARLVASTVNRGQAASSAATTGAAAVTCSKLSSRRRAARCARKAARRSGSGRSPASCTPSAAAIAAGTSAGSASGARPTNHTPSVNASPTSDATANARRVLPTPPGPVKVTSETSGWSRRSRTMATSRSRPISGVSERGRGGATAWARRGKGITRGGAGRVCVVGGTGRLRPAW